MWVFPSLQTILPKVQTTAPTGGLRWGWVELRHAGCGAHTALVRQDVAAGGKRKAAGGSWRPEAWWPLATVLQCTSPRSPTTQFQLTLKPGLSVLSEDILLRVRGLNIFYLKFVR